MSGTDSPGRMPRRTADRRDDPRTVRAGLAGLAWVVAMAAVVGVTGLAVAGLAAWMMAP